MLKILLNAQLQLLVQMMDERRTSFYGTTTGNAQNQLLFGNNVLPSVIPTSLGQGQLEKILKKLNEQQQMLSSAASDTKGVMDSLASLKSEMTEIKEDISTLKDGMKTSLEDHTKKKTKLPKPLLVSFQ